MHSWKGQDNTGGGWLAEWRGGGTSNQGLGLRGSPGSTPIRPAGFAARSPGRDRGRGGEWGEGARRCAHPSDLSTWQLQFARPSLTLHLPGARCRAKPRPMRGRRPPVGASESPAHAPAGVEGAGSSRTALPELWHPGGGTPSNQSLELVGRTGGRGRNLPPPRAAPPSRLAESLHLSPEGLSVLGGGPRKPPAPHRERVEGQPPAPWGGAAWAAGEGAVTQPPSASSPRNFAAAGAAVATGTESFCSPMSGLPGQEGGCHSQVGPRPGHTAHRTSSPTECHRFKPLLPLTLPFTHAKARFLQTLGALRSGGPLTLIWSTNCLENFLMASDLLGEVGTSLCPMCFSVTDFPPASPQQAAYLWGVLLCTYLTCQPLYLNKDLGDPDQN